MSKKLDLDTMSVDEMWQLQERIGRVLSVRLATEKREREKRPARLRSEKLKVTIHLVLAAISAGPSKISQPERTL